VILGKLAREAYGPQASTGSNDCCGGGAGSGGDKVCDFSPREVGNGVNGLMGRHFEAGLENLKKAAER
jgi:hypothetical protein